MAERIVVDTDVWSLLYLNHRDTVPEVPIWRRALVGATVVIAAQTSAEVRYGALKDHWGEGRLTHLESILSGDAIYRGVPMLRLLGVDP